MIRLHWQDETLTVRRLVLRSDARGESSRSRQALARRAGLGLADEAAEPRPGDFWVGCQPERGWGDSPGQVGWASPPEVPVAVAALIAHERPDPAAESPPAWRPLFAADRPRPARFA